MSAISSSYIDPARRYRIEPLRAWTAMQKLIADQEDTQQAFEIVSAFSGNSGRRNFDRFLNAPLGEKLFKRREELTPILSDYNTLAQLPEGSYGRAYLDFVTTEQISAEGLVDESLKVAEREDIYEDDLSWYMRRLRDMHDLWHVLTGYGRNPLGEISLLAFSYSQSKNFGLIFMGYMGARHLRGLFKEAKIMDALWEGKRHGKQAAFLAAEDISAALSENIDDLREKLNIQTPIIYQNVLEDLMAQDMQFASEKATAIIAS